MNATGPARSSRPRLPDWLRPVLVADNDHNIELANGSVGLAFPTTGGRSYTASLVVVDEADFAGTSGADNLDGLLAAVKPTIDAGGRLILLSTADKLSVVPGPVAGCGLRAAPTGNVHSHPAHQDCRRNVR